MPSPFPGVDPYIEGEEWEDFHLLFVAELRRQLTPRLRPKYLVRGEEYVYVGHRQVHLEEPRSPCLLERGSKELGTCSASTDEFLHC